ncbi:MAG: DnaA ATPase domain-containing protein, partial [Actinomycetota bacterium]
MGETAEALWASALQRLRASSLSPGAKPWIEGTRPVRLSGNTLVLAAPSAFAKEWLESRYATLLADTLGAVAGRHLDVQVTVDSRRAAPDLAGGEADDLRVIHTPDIGARRATASSPLSARYNFDSFVIGPSNRFAHAAALAVAEQPARSYNPLFIYGGAGLGKTHLLH